MTYKTYSTEDAESWLRKALCHAPRPLPRGCFPPLLAQGARAGFSEESLLRVLDVWLNYGYCQIIDPITHDIRMTPEGEAHFYRR